LDELASSLVSSSFPLLLLPLFLFRLLSLVLASSSSFFLFLLPLPTDWRITTNLSDSPPTKVRDANPPGRRVGYYDVPGADGGGALLGGAPERKARTSSRWVRAAFSLFWGGGREQIMLTSERPESLDPVKGTTNIT
jgi:hypothetical protein